MRPSPLTASLTCALALAALCLPTGARAGTLTWSMPGDFTTTGSGLNPDHDQYGTRPWRYIVTPGGVMDRFSTRVSAFGLPGWSDSGDAQATLVGVNPTSSVVSSGGGDDFLPGQLALVPPTDRSVGVEWVAPLSTTVTVSWSAPAADAALLCFPPSATITLNGRAMSSTATVAAGDRIDLLVTPNLANALDDACNAVSATLLITAPAAVPAVTLDALGSAPLLTPVPTLTGTAGTAFADQPTASLLVFAGPAVTGSPARTLSVARAPDGSFSAQVAPPLPDGQYTAQAIQQGAVGAGRSAPETFVVKANAPAVSISEPAGGAQIAVPEPLLAGTAGNVIGDDATIHVGLYAGRSIDGPPLGAAAVIRTGAAWSLRWPAALRPGRYTVQATQRDDVGHTGISAPVTFLVVSAPNAIGQSVGLSRGGRLSVPVTCGAPAGDACSGTVLVLTRSALRTVRGGPSGRLRVLFAYVTIPGGRTVTVRRQVPRTVLRVVRRARRLSVEVTAALGIGGAPPATQTAVRRLRRS